eukprot:1194621-Prorocentrum_minimum.AAC.2
MPNLYSKGGGECRQADAAAGGTRRWHQEVAPGGGTRRWHQEVAPGGGTRRWHQEVAPGGTGVMLGMPCKTGHARHPIYRIAIVFARSSASRSSPLAGSGGPKPLDRAKTIANRQSSAALLSLLLSVTLGAEALNIHILALNIHILAL